MDPERGLRRRTFLSAVGAGAVATPLATGSAAATPDGALARAAGDPVQVTLREGTDLAAAVAPDGGLLALDLVGALWTVPLGGGAARRLTDDLFDVAQPDWSPDGTLLLFQSYRDGNFNLWTVRPDGTGLRQLTRGPFDHREPRFAPDGQRVVFSSDRSGSYGIHVLHLPTGATEVWADSVAEEYEPTWSPDGRRIAFVADKTRIDVVDPAGRRSTLVQGAATDQLRSPSFTPDGTDLLYTRIAADGTSQLLRASSATPVVRGEDVFPFRVTWLSTTEFVHTGDGRVRRRHLAGGAVREIPFSAEVTALRPNYVRRQRDFDSAAPQPVRGIGSPVLHPDGDQVAFRALNDLYLLSIGRRAAAITDGGHFVSDPAFSPDGAYLSYSSDRGGTLDIWIRDLRSGHDRQLTNLPGAAAVSATWSRDGSRLAFLDQDGNVYTVEVADGTVRRVYGPLFEPGRPSWSADGQTLALAALKPFSARFREGLSQILLIDLRSGSGTYVEPMPFRSLGTRGDDGPVWSPDGTRMAFVVGSVLWVMPVGPDGRPTGAPRQITDEVTDAPSWRGDSSELLYLSNGRLRIVSADGGRPRTVQTGLTWTNVRPAGRTVIHAGGMWDGRSGRLRHDVDIVVEGNRITAVEPHRQGRGGRLVDASRHTVLPGLVDMHNHREMQGYSYGDRQGRLWLSLGITTTRSPGSPAYHMVEARESVQSGARIAPRYFATGEAVDGSRIFYNFMRPTLDDEQFAREVERAEALSYDLVKSYVRLAPERQRALIEFAHSRGIPATSHYLYPAVAFGGDGMEHTGATNRLGYSRTVSALGVGYQDVIDLFNATGASRTPTLFVSTTLFREDTSLVTDRRVVSLYPPWEYATLQAAVDTAKNTDQTATRLNLRNQVAQIAAMIRGGGRVITGTDSPIDHTAVSTHMNLRAMVRFGLSPLEALRTATHAAGEVLNEPVGQVAPGMYADLVVVDGDPLQRIEDAANVVQVMTNGVLYTVDELVAPFADPGAERGAERAPAAPTNRVLPPLAPHPSDAAYWWHDPHWVADARRSCCSG